MVPPKAFPSGEVLILLNDAWDNIRQYRTLGDHDNSSIYEKIPGEFPRIVQADKIDLKNAFRRPKHGTPEYTTYSILSDFVSKKLGEEKFLDISEMRSELAKAIECDQNEGEGYLRLLVAADLINVKKTGRGFTFCLSPGAAQLEKQRSYAASFAHELESYSSRIGDLIEHRGTVGTYREELLRELLQRHIPQRFHAATGFIHGHQKQIDILIYDQVDYAPIFRIGNLVVVPPESVRAAIEVKTTLSNADLLSGLKGLDDIKVSPAIHGPSIFTGIFAYNERASEDAMLETVGKFYEEEGRDADEDVHSALLIQNPYDTIDAVCVLKKSLLTVEYIQGEGPNNSRAYIPHVVSIENSSKREFQAAWFFDRLSRYLRYPFLGSRSDHQWSEMIGGIDQIRKIRMISKDWQWGPYMFEFMGHDFDKNFITIFEHELESYRRWLNGDSWRHFKIPDES